MKCPINISNNLLPQSKIYINLNALANNVKKLKARCSPDVALMAVVKANGYGHGAVLVAKTALQNGASSLAVARIHEAVELREAGIEAPILLFGDVLPCQLEWLALNGVSITIGSLSSAKNISKAAKEIADSACVTRKYLPLDDLAKAKNHNGLTPVVKVHIKVDTGMGRIGFVIPPLSFSDSSKIEQLNQELFDKVVDEIIEMTTLDNIEVDGIYTHFANADIKDKSHVNEQIEKFNVLINALEKRGFKPRICHASNSAATIEIPEGHFNMVRAGISMYGLYPSDEINREVIELEPVMSVVSKIIHLKDVPSGFKVSYGSTYITSSPTKIATVPIGYADGYSRLLSSKGEMLVKGIRCKVVGRVCMDYTMIDVGNIPNVEVGDDVVVMGRQGDQEILADEIACHINTINYEVVCSFNRRMPIFHI
ncbi:MAG: alanine racemase [Desulfamplus sp.]|nr:alanine racemase [Desulfamplus sp.]